MIEVKNISKSFSDNKVLDDISIVFEKGKTNLVIGESGSGKTVLMKCMVGLHEVDGGLITYDEHIFSDMKLRQGFSKIKSKERKTIRKEIGMMFQGGALFDSLTVEENVIFPLSMFTDMEDEEKCERANFCLNRVNLINADHLYPAELSGGMKKRVAIARAIAMNPKYLFCDEPNSGLDPKNAIVIDNLIKEITDEYEITTVINTHDMNSVIGIGDKIIFIYQGKKWWEGNKEDVLNTDNKEFNEFVYATKYLKEQRI
ncbi:MAG: ATP-binding cassette domain-containing protein [Bacteroidota bacterium]